MGSAGAVIWGQAVTFAADIKVHGSINPGLQGYEVVRESEPRARGQTRGSHGQKACQLARLPWGSLCSAAADKRKWDFHWLLLSWCPGWDVKQMIERDRQLDWSIEEEKWDWRRTLGLSFGLVGCILFKKHLPALYNVTFISTVVYFSTFLCVWREIQSRSCCSVKSQPGVFVWPCVWVRNLRVRRVYLLRRGSLRRLGRHPRRHLRVRREELPRHLRSLHGRLLHRRAPFLFWM